MSEIERVFVRFRGRTIGPFTPDKLREMIRRGQVTRMHELSGDGLSWMKADEFGNFFAPAVSAGSADMAASGSDVPPGAAGYDPDHGDGIRKPVPNENASAQWYAHVNGEKQGPVSMDQMRLFAEAKILKEESMVWRSGMEAWKPASDAIPELFGEPGAGGEVLTSGSSDHAQAVDPTTLFNELAKNCTLILLLGISMVIIGVVMLGVQIYVLVNQSGQTETADYMSTILRFSMGTLVGVSGVLLIVAAGKLRILAEESKLIPSMEAATALNQFWMVASIGAMVWLFILLMVMIAALAINAPIDEILL